MAIEAGAWVKKNESQERGIVISKNGKYVHVLWMGAARAKACSLKDLRPCQAPRALVLEGYLDKKLESTRSEQDVLRTWLTSHNVPLAYKNITTLEDIRIIGKAVGKNKPPFVHISCHGEHNVKRAYISLSHNSDPIYLDDDNTIKVFREVFEGMPILFSTCLLGRYNKEMIRFRENAQLSNIATFTRKVYDTECMLFELLLYNGLFVNGWPFVKAVQRAEQALNVAGIKGVRRKGLVQIF